MHTTRLAWWLTVLTAATALTVTAGPLSAVASTPSGWRISATIGSAKSAVNEGDIVAAGADAAWVIWTCGPCPSGSAAHQNLLQAWNGKTWSQPALPSALSYPTAIAGLGASSAKNLWVFTGTGRAAVFNGSHWTVSKLPSWVARPVKGGGPSVGTAVFSPSNVWAFSLLARKQPTLAGHFTGGKWHKVTLPIVPLTADGLAPNDIWLFGSKENASERTLAHWNGSSWQTVAFPKAPSGDILTETDPVAAGSKSFLAIGELLPKRGGAKFEVQHWTGHWTTTTAPASVGIITQAASDGHGGLWLIASSETGSDFVHYTGGHWDTSAFPSQGKLLTAPHVLVPIQKTRSMWALGFLFKSSTPEFGAILRYDP